MIGKNARQQVIAEGPETLPHPAFSKIELPNLAAKEQIVELRSANIVEAPQAHHQ